MQQHHATSNHSTFHVTVKTEPGLVFRYEAIARNSWAAHAAAMNCFGSLCAVTVIPKRG